jgi:hypothetical protein
MIFCIKYKLYKYKVLLFGLINSLVIFQCFINDILIEYLDNFCLIYLDDILIYFNFLKKHKIHIKKIMQILFDYNL